MASAIEIYHSKKIALYQADAELSAIRKQLRALAEELVNPQEKPKRPGIRFPVGTTEEEKRDALNEVAAESGGEEVEDYPVLRLLPTEAVVRAAIEQVLKARRELAEAFDCLSNIEKEYAKGLSSTKYNENS